MNNSVTIYPDIQSMGLVVEHFKRKTAVRSSERPSGLCGFDGFVDAFVRLQAPRSMAEFGPKVEAAAGISTSFSARYLGEKFGGNGPLFAAALSDIHTGRIDITYIGAIGCNQVAPIFQAALGGKIKRLFPIASPACTTCLEFSDGKVMLNDLAACEEVTWGRLLERVGEKALDQELKAARFISAVNWGKLPHAGPIWSNLSAWLAKLGVPAKQVIFFMDLAEFESRPAADREDLLARLPAITRQCHTMMSLNLKEAWQLAEVFGGAFQGRKEVLAVAELAAFLHSRIGADRVIVHPNDGAACAGPGGTVYLPGPFCREPLISTGAGDNFGAGCLSAALHGLDDSGIVLAGNCASGYFVRTGRSASFEAMATLLEAWSAGTLGQ
jgi:pfkB family carbohydrate kinase